MIAATTSYSSLDPERVPAAVETLLYEFLDEQTRNEIAHTGRRLEHDGLLSATAGNISARVAPDAIAKSTAIWRVGATTTSATPASSRAATSASSPTSATSSSAETRRARIGCARYA